MQHLMKRRAWALWCATLLIAGWLTLSGRSLIETPPPAIPPVAQYPVARTIQYSFTLQNTSANLLPQAEFWTYAPVKLTSIQKAGALRASQPYQLLSDSLGNQILYFRLENLAPYATKLIVIKAELALSDESNPADVQPIFTEAEKYIESDNADLQAVAKGISGGAGSSAPKNILDWISNAIAYAGFIEADLGALSAIRDRRGDCTEFSYLFTALARASGVPSRAMGGYVLSENAVLKASDYHNWAEFYQDGKWYIADAQKKVFMEQQSRYVAMRIISGRVKNPLGNAHRFLATGGGIKVTMN